MQYIQPYYRNGTNIYIFNSIYPLYTTLCLYNVLVHFTYFSRFYLNGVYFYLNVSLYTVYLYLHLYLDILLYLLHISIGSVFIQHVHCLNLLNNEWRVRVNGCLSTTNEKFKNNNKGFNG